MSAHQWMAFEFAGFWLLIAVVLFGLCVVLHWVVSGVRRGR